MHRKPTIFIWVMLLIFPAACNSRPKFVQELPEGVHKVTLKEHINTTNYTYLHVDENGKSVWLAIPKMEDAKDGQTYYYKGGMVMTNFKSTELKRTFPSVIFLEKVAASPDLLEQRNIPASTHSAMVKKNSKLDLKIEPVSGGITIAELYAQKEKYNGKTVTVRGKITKVNAKIMGRNWVHLQDGTEYNGVYDLTATTKLDFNVGDIVTLTGKIALNKDFGYGYKYEVLMEDAVSSK